MILWNTNKIWYGIKIAPKCYKKELKKLEQNNNRNKSNSFSWLKASLISMKNNFACVFERNENKNCIIKIITNKPAAVILSIRRKGLGLVCSQTHVIQIFVIFSWVLWFWVFMTFDFVQIRTGID